MDNLCKICYDEDNNNIYKQSCNNCNFECCNICYLKNESNRCPQCNNPHFKEYHEETIFESEISLLDDIINNLNIYFQVRYDNLINTIQTQKNIIDKYEQEAETIECECGKTINRQNYKKHLETKYHKKHCV